MAKWGKLTIGSAIGIIVFAGVVGYLTKDILYGAIAAVVGWFVGSAVEKMIKKK